MEHIQTRTVTTDEEGKVKELSTFMGPGQESFVEISENSKGEPRVTVKVYHPDIDLALENAVRTYFGALQMLKMAEESR